MFDILRAELVSTPGLPFTWCASRNEALHVHFIDDNEEVNVCEPCQLSLSASQIPLFSIVNWVFPEKIPDFMQENTIAENIACSKVRNDVLYF